MTYDIPPEDLDAIQAMLDAGDLDGLEHYLALSRELREMRERVRSYSLQELLAPIEGATLLSRSVTDLGGQTQWSTCANCNQQILRPAGSAWLHQDGLLVTCADGSGPGLAVATPK